MRKDSRLSFRISGTLSERIDRAIEKAGGQIRDRSEFGTKSVEFYLDFIENAYSMEDLINRSIIALANHIGLNSPEITEIKQLSEQKMRIPNLVAEAKRTQDHPQFENTVNLLEKLEGQDAKSLSYILRDAGYEDIEDIYQTFSKLAAKK